VQARAEDRVLQVGASSSSDEIANRCAAALDPRPLTCGNTNHIQWLRFRPRRSSSIASS